MATVFEKVMSNRGQAAVLLNADPPEHRRQRKAVNPAFRPSKIRSLEPMITEVTDRLLDEVVGRGEMDAVADFAVGLPMTIIAYALGVGDDDLATLASALDRQSELYQAEPDLAAALLGVGESPRDESLPPTDHAALTAVCLAILNLDEALTRE